MQNHHLTSISTSPKKTARPNFFHTEPISGKYSMYKIQDNALPTEQWRAIHDLCANSNRLPYYLSNSVANEGEDYANQYYFTHQFYDNYNVNSPEFDVIFPLVELLAPSALVRIKANLYPSTHSIIVHDPHTDFDFNHRAALYMVNTCDGYTTMSDGTRIDSVANRIVFFDPQQLHSSSTTTDARYRITINFNYF